MLPENPHKIDQRHARILYCDESGSEGGALWNSKKHFFTHAALWATSAEIEEIYAELRSIVKTDVPELKFRHFDNARKLNSLRETFSSRLFRTLISGKSASMVTVFAADKLFFLIAKLVDLTFMGEVSSPDPYRQAQLDCRLDQLYTCNVPRSMTEHIYTACKRADDDGLLVSTILEKFNALFLSKDEAARTANQTSLEEAIDNARRHINDATLKEILDAIFETRHNITDYVTTSCDGTMDKTDKSVLDPQIAALGWQAMYHSSHTTAPLHILHDETTFWTTQRRADTQAALEVDHIPWKHYAATIESFTLANSRECPGIQIADIIAGFANRLLQEAPTANSLLAAFPHSQFVGY